MVKDGLCCLCRNQNRFICVPACLSLSDALVLRPGKLHLTPSLPVSVHSSHFLDFHIYMLLLSVCAFVCVWWSIAVFVCVCVCVWVCVCVCENEKRQKSSLC